MAISYQDYLKFGAGRHNKFFTDEHQHARHKALYNLRWGFPKRSAMDPAYLQQWIERNGPYLYHATSSPAARRIVKEGLYPHDWDEHGPIESRSKYSGDFYYPRPNHVYMGTQDYIHTMGYRNNGPMLQIDLRKLDPAKLNPDEDHFDSPQRFHPLVDQVWQRYGAPPTAQDWVTTEGTPTFGEWAEKGNLGGDPAETHYSLNKGSISHQGMIPPDAIEYAAKPITAKTDAKHWEGKMWHANNRGHIGFIHTPFWTTSDPTETDRWGDTSHDVSVRFKRPLYLGYTDEDLIRHGLADQAQREGHDGIVMFHPENKQWAIALDPGTVVPGHDHEWPY